MFLSSTSNPIFRFLDHGPRAESGKIVAVEGNVERADRNRRFFDSLDKLPQAFRDGHSPTPNPDQAQALGTVVFLDDFVGETDQGAFDFRGGHELRLLAQPGLRSGLLVAMTGCHHTRADPCRARHLGTGGKRATF